MKFGSCIILQSGESSTSFNKNNRVYFSGEKKWNETIQGIHFFLRIHEKTSNQISSSKSSSFSDLKVSSRPFWIIVRFWETAHLPLP